MTRQLQDCFSISMLQGNAVIGQLVERHHKALKSACHCAESLPGPCPSLLSKAKALFSTTSDCSACTMASASPHDDLA